MGLSEQLAAKKADSKKKIPAEIQKIMISSTNALKERSLGSQAAQKGDTLPNFKLPDVHGKKMSLNDFDTDFLIVSFYRGGWCPYCNMELRALQEVRTKLQSLNTELIAISPETPDNSLTTSEKNELSFSVLSDIDNAYAKTLGLVFKMPEDLQAVYDKFGIKVNKHNGNAAYELPMPATYIVNKEREIIYSFVPEDYTERLDPETILKVLGKATS